MTYEFGTADYAADGMFCGEGDESIDGVCPVVLNCVTEEKSRSEKRRRDCSTYAEPRFETTFAARRRVWLPRI